MWQLRGKSCNILCLVTVSRGCTYSSVLHHRPGSVLGCKTTQGCVYVSRDVIVMTQDGILSSVCVCVLPYTVFDWSNIV